MLCARSSPRRALGSTAGKAKGRKYDSDDDADFVPCRHPRPHRHGQPLARCAADLPAPWPFLPPSLSSIRDAPLPWCAPPALPSATTYLMTKHPHAGIEEGHPRRARKVVAARVGRGQGTWTVGATVCRALGWAVGRQGGCGCCRCKAAPHATRQPGPAQETCHHVHCARYPRPVPATLPTARQLPPQPHHSRHSLPALLVPVADLLRQKVAQAGGHHRGAALGQAGAALQVWAGTGGEGWAWRERSRCAAREVKRCSWTQSLP